MPDTVPILSESEVVRLIHEHIKTLFPKACARCQQRFATYRDYLAGTKPVGLPVSYDLEMGEVQPAESTGNLSLANCPCGNTISLSSDGMLVTDLWKVLKWIKFEAERRTSPIQEVLAYVRDEVMKCELSASP